MKRRSLAYMVGFCCLLFFAGTLGAAEITNPMMTGLLEKGIQTQQEATPVPQDLETENVAQNKEGQPTAESTAEFSKDLERVVKALKGFKFGGLWYLSYQNGETGNTTGGSDYNQFVVKRGYLTVEKEFYPWFQARLTYDVTTVSDPDSNLNGSLTARLKYLYGKFIGPDISVLTKPNAEFGLVHMPWLDFEEHVNYYRCQDTLFLERNSIFNSADYGITFASLFGGVMDEEYRKNVNSAYPGRYGSIQAGVYNGTGYHESEQNQNKVLEGRVTVRPLPDIIPGLQLSYFGLTGKGNTAQEPDWNVSLAFASFEHKYFVLTGQYYWGKGNQAGADQNDREGYSFFAELKPLKKLSVIGRFDHFDPNTDIGSNDNNRIIAGIAYHIDKQHQNMILLDYDTVQYAQLGKSNDNRVQLTLQVAF
jgi:hypothetical protein